MILRSTALASLTLGILGLMSASVVSQDKKPAPKSTPADAAKAKKALQEVQEFIGLWNLEGVQKDGAKTIAWQEKLTWGWKFKDGDSWITVEFAPAKGKGTPKVFTGGVLWYDVAKKKYLLNLTGVDKTEQTFEGDLGRNGGLVLTRKDAKTGDVYKLTLNTLSEGIRFQLKFEKQDGGKGLFGNVFAMNGSKDGESFAGGAKKPECIVSGGAANIAVAIAGKTYYVCCTGCRDELLANPDKYTKAKK